MLFKAPLACEQAVYSRHILASANHRDFLMELNFKGVHLYLNGSAAKQKAFPKQEVTFVKPEYSHGWSIGRPNEIFKLTKYGSFGIAHLAQWLRELTAVEIRAAFYETILHGKPTTGGLHC